MTDAAKAAAQMGSKIAKGAKVMDITYKTALDRSGKAVIRKTAIVEKSGRRMTVAWTGAGKSVKALGVAHAKSAAQVNDFGMQAGKAMKRVVMVVPIWMAFRTAMMAVLRTIGDGMKLWEEWDAQLIKSKAVIHGVGGKIEEAFRRMTVEIKEWGLKTGETLVNLTSAFYRFGTVGLDFEESMAGMKVASELAIAMFGDSVKGDTPVLIRNKKTKKIELVPIEDLHNKHSQTIRQAVCNKEIWTDKGWSKINYVYKHKVNKKGFKIRTRKQFVEVTEDHSLILDGKEVKPKDIDRIEFVDYILPESLNIDKDWAWFLGFFAAKGTIVKYTMRLSNKQKKLLEKAKKVLEKVGILSKIKKDNNIYYLEFYASKLQSYFRKLFYTEKKFKKIPFYILTANKESKKEFLNGFIDGDGYRGKCGFELANKSKSVIAGLGMILDSLNIDYYVGETRNCLRIRQRLNNKKSKIRKPIFEKTEIWIKDYVYDVGTANRHFCGGVGNVLLHNTDELAKTLAGTYLLLGDTIDQTIPVQDRMRLMGAELYLLWKTNAFEIAEMTGALQRFIPVAKTANFTYSQSIGLLATLHSAQMKGTMAGRLLRTSVLRMVSNLDMLADSLGMRVNPQLEDTFTVLMRVLGAVKEMSVRGAIPTEAIAAIADVFGGVRGGEPIRALTSLFDVLQENLAAIEDADMGDLFALLDDRIEEVTDSVGRQLIIFRQLRTVMGETFLKGVFGGEEFAETMARINDWLRRNLILVERLGSAVAHLPAAFLAATAPDIWIRNIVDKREARRLGTIVDLAEELRRAMKGELPLAEIEEIKYKITIMAEAGKLPEEIPERWAELLNKVMADRLDLSEVKKKMQDAIEIGLEWAGIEEVKELQLALREKRKELELEGVEVAKLEEMIAKRLGVEKGIGLSVRMRISELQNELELVEMQLLGKTKIEVAEQELTDVIKRRAGIYLDYILKKEGADKRIVKGSKDYQDALDYIIERKRKLLTMGEEGHEELLYIVGTEKSLIELLEKENEVRKAVLKTVFDKSEEISKLRDVSRELSVIGVDRISIERELLEQMKQIPEFSKKDLENKERLILHLEKIRTIQQGRLSIEEKLREMALIGVRPGTPEFEKAKLVMLEEKMTEELKKRGFEEEKIIKILEESEAIRRQQTRLTTADINAELKARKFEMDTIRKHYAILKDLGFSQLEIEKMYLETLKHRTDLYRTLDEFEKRKLLTAIGLLRTKEEIQKMLDREEDILADLQLLGYSSLDIEKARLELMEQRGAGLEGIYEQEREIAELQRAEIEKFATEFKDAWQEGIAEVLKGEATITDFFTTLSDRMRNIFIDRLAGVLTDEMFKVTGIGEMFGKQMFGIGEMFEGTGQVLSDAHLDGITRGAIVIEDAHTKGITRGFATAKIPVTPQIPFGIPGMGRRHPIFPPMPHIPFGGMPGIGQAPPGRAPFLQRPMGGLMGAVPWRRGMGAFATGAMMGWGRGGAPGAIAGGLGQLLITNPKTFIPGLILSIGSMLFGRRRKEVIRKQDWAPEDVKEMLPYLGIDVPARPRRYALPPERYHFTTEINIRIDKIEGERPDIIEQIAKEVDKQQEKVAQKYIHNIMRNIQPTKVGGF